MSVSSSSNASSLLAGAHTRKPGALLEELVRRAQALPPVRMGVVHPCDAPSLEGALAAGEARLIVPTLIGPRSKIEAVAEAAGLSLEGVEIVDAPYSHAAAATAVEMVGLPEAIHNLAHAVVHMSLAPKSRAVTSAVWAAITDVREGRTGEPPVVTSDTTSFRPAGHPDFRYYGGVDV